MRLSSSRSLLTVDSEDGDNRFSGDSRRNRLIPIQQCHLIAVLREHLSAFNELPAGSEIRLLPVNSVGSERRAGQAEKKSSIVAAPEIHLNGFIFKRPKLK